MRFVYYCCFVILFNSFFCFGDRGERRPDAWARTPKVKKFVPWKQTSRSIVTSHISKKGCRKRKSISVSTRDQERIKKHIEQINIPDFVKTITELWIFPNDYEYEAVYKSLEEDAHVESKLGQDKIGIRILSNKLYEGCRIKKPAWALFDLGGKKIFMITCGEGTYQILPFIKNCFNVFKNLKKVFLGGICGCSSMEVDIGAVLIPKSYIFISKISLGDALNREKIEQDGSVEKKGKTYQYDHVYFYEKDIIETEFPLDFSLKIKDSLETFM